MKIIVVVTCVLIILSQKSSQKPNEAKMKDYRLCLQKEYKKDCVKETGIKEDHITLIERNQLVKDNMTKVDKCYFSCMLIYNNVILANGKLNTTRITQTMSDKMTAEIKKFIQTYTKVFQSSQKNDCIQRTNMFLNIISALQTKKEIRFTLVFKGSKSN